MTTIIQRNLSQGEVVSGSSVMLNGAPVMFKSGTQRHVELSVTKVELYATVNCAQDILYFMNVLQQLDLTVNLPMVLEVDNQGAVHLAKNWIIGGCAGHIDVRQYFLQELKEAGILIVKQIPGSENKSGLSTKNLGGSLFETFTQVYVGEDEYAPTAE